MKNNERSSRLAQGRTESALMLRSRAHARGVSKHGPRDRSPHPSRRRFAPPQDEASKAPPRGPRWLVRSPVFSCFFAKIGTVPVRGGRGSAMHHSLTLALHRVRDAKARTRLPTPIHFSNSPCLQDERLRARATQARRPGKISGVMSVKHGAASAQQKAAHNRAAFMAGRIVPARSAAHSYPRPYLRTRHRIPAHGIFGCSGADTPRKMPYCGAARTSATRRILSLTPSRPHADAKRRTQSTCPVGQLAVYSVAERRDVNAEE